MTSADPPPLNRPSYADHQLLTLADFNDEQTFHLVSRDLAQRMFWTAGVLAGLAVAAAPAATGHLAGSGLTISAGIALDGGGRLLVMPTDSQLNLDDPSWYAVGQTRHWVLAISFVEQPNAAKNRWSQTGTLALVTPGALPSGAMPLAGLAISATQSAPSTSGTPSVVELQVVIDATVVVQAVMRPERLPAIQADQLTGQLSPAQLPEVPASKITGALSVDQVPDLPVSKLTGAFAADQLPDVPASKVTGELTVDQIPELPASKLTGELTVDQIPELPATKLTGQLAAGQIPVLPPANIAGPLDERQIPELTSILARLTALENAIKPPQPPPPPPQHQLLVSVVSGDNQTATLVPAGAHPVARFAPIQVSVIDSAGEGLAGVQVTFVVGSQPAPLTVQLGPSGDQTVTVITDSTGLATLALMGGNSAWAYYGSGSFTLIATTNAFGYPAASVTVHLTVQPAPSVTAPNVVGMAPQQAGVAAGNAGLLMVVLGVQSQPGIPDNVISAQSPAAGTSCPPGSQLGVYMSSLSQPGGVIG